MNKLKDFKNCDKGHFYPISADVCPYCPKGSEGSNDKTKVIGGASDPTSLPPKSEDPTIKTQIFSDPNVNPDTKKTPKTNKFDPNRTVITPGTKIKGSSTTDSSDDKSVKRRKLRAWLVTFDLKDMEYGVDFKIEEGRNTIGKAASSDITIDDNEVSSNHALILCKRDKFMLTDELSSNGTFLNGEDLTPKAVYDLKDGDEIEVGHTTLLFKQAFK